MSHFAGVSPAPAPPDALRSLADLDQVIFDALPLGAYVCDAEGVILRFNHRAAILWGRSPVLENREKFCGAHRRMTSDGEILSPANCPMAVALREGLCFHNEPVLIERPDGHRLMAQMTISPLLDREGAVVGAINCFQDITRAHALEVRAARDEAALRASRRRADELLEALPMAILTTDAEGRLTFFNRAAAKFAGREPQLGEDSWCVSAKLYWPDGSAMAHEDCPMAVAIRERRPSLGEVEAVAERPDGTKIPFIPFASPLFDEAGAMVGAVNILVDISERKSAEKRNKLLIDELNHRVKNTLATVQSIALQTLSEADSLDRFKRGYEGRLVALSRTHDLLVQTHWQSAELTQIVRQELESFGQAQFEVSGPDIELSPRSAVTLSMIVHELAANAAGQGALASKGGRIEVTWSVTGDELQVSWHELGSGALPLAREGFGSRLIERAVTRDLGGESSLAFGPEGLRCHIRIPLAENVVRADWRAHDAQAQV